MCLSWCFVMYVYVCFVRRNGDFSCQCLRSSPLNVRIISLIYSMCVYPLERILCVCKCVRLKLIVAKDEKYQNSKFSFDFF